MMQEASAVPVAERNPFATSAASSLFLEAQSFRQAGKGFSSLKGKGRGARSRSVLEVQDAAALVEETVAFYVKATGKDEGRIRQKLAETKSGELWRCREHWRTCAEEPRKEGGCVGALQKAARSQAEHEREV